MCLPQTRPRGSHQSLAYAASQTLKDASMLLVKNDATIQKPCTQGQVGNHVAVSCRQHGRHKLRPGAVQVPCTAPAQFESGKPKSARLARRGTGPHQPQSQEQLCMGSQSNEGAAAMVWSGNPEQIVLVGKQWRMQTHSNTTKSMPHGGRWLACTHDGSAHYSKTQKDGLVLELNCNTLG